MAFSERATWDERRNRLAVAVVERRRSGRPILDLTETNPSRVGIPYPADAIRAALSSRGVLAYFPSPKGSTEARRAVAQTYAARGVEVEPERVVLTASTSEAYAFLFKVLADPGDAVLVPRPSYPLFEFLARLEGVGLATYPLRREEGWRIDMSALEDAVTARTRAIVVVHPNNPTGSFVDRCDADALASFAASRDLAIVSDEVFGDYPFGDDGRRAGSFAGEHRCLTFTLGGLSKSCGLPQVKLAWCVLGGPSAARAEAEARLETVGDTFLSVSASAQAGAAALIRAGETVRDAIRSRTASNLETLTRALRGGPGTLLEPEGGWSAVVRVPAVQGDEEWAIGLLEAEDLLVQPGWFYDFDTEGHLVVSLLPRTAEFRDGAERLARYASLVAG